MAVKKKAAKKDDKCKCKASSGKDKFMAMVAAKKKGKK